MKNQLVNHTIERKWCYISEIINEPRKAIAFLHGFAVVGKIDTFVRKRLIALQGFGKEQKQVSGEVLERGV